MVSIVNYGVGNLKSLQNAFRFLGIQSKLVDKPEEILQAERLILPGVGAFGYAMQNIQELNFQDALTEKAKSGTPILGICLGMQVMLSISYENGEHQGLNFVPGKVRQFEIDLKIPQMGWNEIECIGNSPLFKNLPDSKFAYFVHSYICVPDDGGSVIATCEYEKSFCAAFARENIFGVQFHPEKSQELGLQILKNFTEI